MIRVVLALLLALASSGLLAAGESVRDRAAKRLQRRWDYLQKTPPRMGVRDLFGFVLDAAVVGWDSERIARVLALAEQMQDRDESSRTFGNFKWYWEAEKPADRNAVEFSMQKAMLVWMLHKDRLNPEGIERLARLIQFSVEGIRRHHVPVFYTNIYLMKTWNSIAIGEATDRPDVADEGYQMLDCWLLYTWENGIHEYLSPTYYGVDLDSLGLIARFAKNAATRRKAEVALRLFWTDLAANWFSPCQRLGGAHSRDYDYLTGHGYVSRHLTAAGWLEPVPSGSHSVFDEYCRWGPPADVREAPVTDIPRTIHQRWGTLPSQHATHYVGSQVSVGSAGECYGPMDKALVVNLAGGPQMPVVNFFMDARGVPYGKNKTAMASGHHKALHLMPFLTSVQRGPEVLLLASADPLSKSFDRYAPEPTCLLSHIVLPAGVEFWIGDTPIAGADRPERVDVPRNSAVFLRFQDVAVGIRFVLALDTAGAPASVTLVNDGGRYDAARLTVTHSTEVPRNRGTVGFWVRAAENLEAAAFVAFRDDFAQATARADVDGTHVAVSVPGVAGRLRLAADVATGERLVCEGGEPEADGALLAVNGRDLGRELLADIDCVARHRRLLAAAQHGGPEAARTEEPVQAEDALLLVRRLQIGHDDSALGGQFIWVPGEPGQARDGGYSRALWLIHVPRPATYNLWGRIQAPTPRDDSFYVRVLQDGHEALPLTDWHAGVHEHWEWTPVRGGREREVPRLELKQGAVTIEVRGREDGTRLDALFLTSKPDAPPQLP